jgi:serine phosphatase RsbU (regulator of sigma subunit)/anti-sigma regulatory factor (Ser/Thr protein kinase)
VSRSGRLRPHRATVIAVLAVLVVAAALVAAAAGSIRVGNERYLNSQGDQVAGALAASLEALDQPLTAMAQVGTASGDNSDFRALAGPEVGPGAPFRSVSLWSVAHGQTRRLVLVGAEPQLALAPGHANALLRLQPMEQLQVVGLADGSQRSLGIAEVRASGGGTLVTYAEDVLPTPPLVHYGPGSIFSHLAFAIYLGASVGHGTLLESTVPVPVRTAHTVRTVSFGGRDATIVSALATRPPGVLPGQVPWLILAAGVLIAVAAAMFVERLARRRDSAEAVASASLDRYEAERSVSHALQQALLPDALPAIVGLEVAAKYVAGVETLDVGGDWYDVIELGDGRCFLTVGDVAGRGVPAAALMGSIRPAVRAYAVQGDDPATVLAKLDGLVSVERDGGFATVLCAILDPSTGQLEIASAGHLPPLVVADGHASLVVVPIGVPVGVRGPARPTSTTWALAPDATLIAYTDGLVERRELTIDEGLARLREASARLSGDLDRGLSRLSAELVPERATDDVAILAARRVTSAPMRWSRRFAPSESAVAEARGFVGAHLSALGEARRADALLMTSELATNAVQHAAGPFEVAVELADAGRRVRVSVTDWGPGIGAPAAGPGAAPSDARGRGLSIIQRLAGSTGVERAGGANVVWFEVTGADRPSDAPSPAKTGAR